MIATVAAICEATPTTRMTQACRLGGVGVMEVTLVPVHDLRQSISRDDLEGAAVGGSRSGGRATAHPGTRDGRVSAGDATALLPL
ncbi:hypothetical protein C272_00225 [Brevibacterium casei S18]|uniref:Uncharacterized protein n=1 Tax=Brevibacterium casei S18 TaxID=1229781 RepID=K9B5Q1_9MICO|nr:hypothetical protein C272_00225 [Brevibacterium casei S18]